MDKTETKPIQVEISPFRLLQPETAERLLNEIDGVEGVIRILIQGQNLPRRVPSGPGTGLPVEHPDRQIIQVGGQAFELTVLVGRIRVEIEDEVAKENLRKACARVLPFPFEFREGHFLKRKPTLVDYAKYGFKGKKDERINLEDERLLGMVDPKAKPREKIYTLKPKTG